jgi:hypothetical protein
LIAHPAPTRTGAAAMPYPAWVLLCQPCSSIVAGRPGTPLGGTSVLLPPGTLRWCPASGGSGAGDASPAIKLFILVSRDFNGGSVLWSVTRRRRFPLGRGTRRQVFIAGGKAMHAAGSVSCVGRVDKSRWRSPGNAARGAAARPFIAARRAAEANSRLPRPN